MAQRTVWPPVLTLALAILSNLMLLVWGVGNSASIFAPDWTHLFPLMISCFVGCTAVGVVVAVMASWPQLAVVWMKIFLRVMLLLLLGASAFVAWFSISVLADTNQLNNGLIYCSTVDGTCGPPPFDWTPFLIATATVVLLIVEATLYLIAARRQNLPRADRALAVVVMTLSTIPVANIAASLILLRRSRLAMGSEPSVQEAG